MSNIGQTSPSVLFLPLALMGKITYEEAERLTKMLMYHDIPTSTIELKEQIEKLLERKLE